MSYNSSMPNFMNAETALLLLELDASLHKLKDNDGVTAFQLLAEMPTAFESGFPMGICERLIYCCMPTLTTLLDLTCIYVYAYHRHMLYCLHISCMYTMDTHTHTHSYMYIMYICVCTHTYKLNSILCCRPSC